MARRSTVEKVLIATGNFTAGTGELVTAVSDSILAPKEVCIAAGGSAASVTLTHGAASGLFLTASVPANDTACVFFPDGLELTKGDNIEVTTDQTVDVTLHYCLYDESAGVTKVASRAATFSNVTVTRAPNAVPGQAQS